MDEFSKRKSNHFKVLTILAIVVSLSLGVYMYRAKEVILSIDGVEKEIVSYANTVEDFLEMEGIILEEGTYINVPLDIELENYINIVIKTPKAYILSTGDKQSKVHSVHTNVEDILRDLDVVLGKQDYTYPDLKDEIEIGEEIQIFRIKEVIETLDEAIPHESIVNNSDKLEIGTSNLIQEGKDGINQIEIKKVYKNDELISEDIIGEEVIEKPLPRIAEKGTKKPAPKKVSPKAKEKEKPVKQVASRGGSRSNKSITMTATAYDLSFQSCGKNPGDPYYGITASGTKARPGAVAVDPNVIPLGTKLYIESLDGTPDYGHAIAEDTGGAIKNNKIDLFFHTATEVRNFGRRKVKVYILN